MVIYHIDMVILDIDMGYGLVIWEMTVSIRSSPLSTWDFLSLCLGDAAALRGAQAVECHHRRHRCTRHRLEAPVRGGLEPGAYTRPLFGST